MTVYVDYTFYTNTYLGTVIPSADFGNLAVRASANIDRITFNRVAPIITANTDTATIALIKMATCAVAEELKKQDAIGGLDGLQSESLAGSSVSYNSKAQAQKTNSMKVTQAAVLFLADTGLMYKGFAIATPTTSNEYSGKDNRYENEY
jgi:hypothetical protein